MLSINLLFVFVTVLVANAQRQELVFQGGNFVLGWEFNPAGTVITVDATANTTGYLGVGFTDNAGYGMPGSDIIIGGYDEVDGMNYFGDFYAPLNGAPLLDPQQDAILLGVSQTDGRTMVRFSRLVNTGDPNPGHDVDIKSNTLFMWAYGATDVVFFHGLNAGKSPQSEAKLNRFVPPPIPYKFPKLGNYRSSY